MHLYLMLIITLYALVFCLMVPALERQRTPD